MAPAFAATKVWIATDSLAREWSNAANWQGGVAPASGDRLVFRCCAVPSSTNDMPGLVLDGLDFEHYHVLQGVRVELAGATPLTVATDTTSGPIITADVRFSAPSLSINIAGTPVITFGGAVVFAGGTATISAPGVQIDFGQPVSDESPVSLVISAHQVNLHADNTFQGTLSFTGDGGGWLSTRARGLGAASAGTTVQGDTTFYIQSQQPEAIAEPLDLRMSGASSLFSVGGSQTVFQGPIAITGTQHFSVGVDATFTGPISGNGRLVVDSTPYPVTFGNSGNTFTQGLQVAAANVHLTASGAVPAAGELVIGGGGSVDFATYAQRVQAFTCGGTIAMAPGATLRADTAVDVRGCTLQLSYLSPPSGEVRLIDNGGSSPVLGTFAGLPERSPVTVAGATFYISYVGGDGNDVILRATEFPPAISRNKTWAGPSTGLWSNPANWQGGVAPVNGDRLIFPAGSNIASTNDIVNGVFDGIDVGDVSSLSGNPFTLSSATPLTVQNRIGFGQAVRFASPSPAMTVGNNLDFSGAVTFAGGNVHIVGLNAQLSFHAAILEEAPTSLAFDVFEVNLFAANSFTGTLTINAGGTVNAFNGALGSTSSGSIFSAYGLYVMGYQNQTFAEPLALNNVGGFGIDASVITSPIALSGVTTFAATNTAARFTGLISGSGRMVVPRSGPAITLSAANTFSGGLQVNGDVRVDSFNSLPASSELVIEQLGNVDIGANSQTVRRLACNGTLAMAAPAVLHVNQSVDITGCTLQLSFPPGYVAPSGNLAIIDNQGSTAIAGAFMGMPEGTMVMINGAARYIHYGTTADNADNDVVLRTTLGTPDPSTAPNVQDMWWAGPSGNGWGMSLVQHRDTLFAGLYIYDASGKATWLVMPGGAWDAAHKVYTGSLYTPSGTPFFAYDASRIAVGNPKGTISLTFQDNDHAVLTYTIEGVSGFKLITREVFAAGGATTPDHSDLWWGGVAQDGWGITIIQQSSTLFPVWYTYDASGAATWYVMPDGAWTSSETYEGHVYRTTGSPWVGRDYDPTKLQVFAAGTFRIRFTGDTGTFDYTVDGHSGAIPLVREAF